MDPLHKSVPNWQNKILQGQHVEDDYYNVKGSIVKDIIYAENFKERGFLKEWKYATGYGLMALTTKLLFTYLGGMIQARRQFIPGYLYFTNRFYNWVGGAKYIVGGYLLGSIVSSFTFGQPFILEDLIRRQYRRHTDVKLFEEPRPQ